MLSRKGFLIVCLLTLMSRYAIALFKMTNLHCESYNKSWVVINKCRLRAIRRGITAFNMNITFLEPTYKIDLRMAFVKRFNGYKPFLYNFTLDACEYISKRNNPIVNVVYSLYKDFSNINHSCPYMGDQILDNFYLKEDLLPLSMPTGEYGILMTWSFHKLKIFVTNVYFSFEDGKY